MELYDKIIGIIPNEKHRKLIVLKNLSFDLYNQVIENTNFLVEETNLQHRLKFLKKGLKELPQCKTCGKSHQYFNDKKELSDYCCKECYFSDHDEMKNRLKNVDQNQKKIRVKKTLIEKYGFEYNSQRPEIKKILQRSKLERSNPTALEFLSNENWLKEQYKNKTSVQIASDLGIYYGTVIDYLQKYNIEIKYYINKSSIEKEICEYLSSMEITFFTSVRSVLKDNYELDIYIPDHNLAIEINGLYWHSYLDFKSENKNKHLKKTMECLDKGIRLIHFTDFQCFNQKDIVKSVILNALGKSKRIYARNCIIKEISKIEHDSFCEQNHINGTSSTFIRYGLFFEEELVQVISLAKPRWNKDYDYELIRLCTKKFINVVGGASKLFYAIKEKYNNIICYSDRQYGEGKVFEKIGFVFKGSTKIGYSWTDRYVLYNRMNFQKHLLKNKLKKYSEDKSETENMIENGYRMYFDCGNNIWEYKK